MGSLQQLGELSRVRILSFLREPEALFWTFAFPPILAIVLGWAFRETGPKPSKVALARGPGAEAVEPALKGADGIELEWADDVEASMRLLRRGAIDALVFPGDPPTVRLDPSRPESDQTRLRIAAALEHWLDGPEDGGSREPPIALEPVSEKGSRYVDFLFPGLIGLNLMGTGMFLIGFAIADLRQKKVLKRLLVTPMRRSWFLLSFFLARLAFLVLEIAAMIAFGTLALGVPFRGSPLDFALICLVGALAFCGIGLLLTSRVKTIQGASGMLNLALVPMWLLGGVFFSYERFPEVLHPLLRAIPLTAMNDALRAVLLDGTGILGVSTQLGVLAAWGVGTFLLALVVYRWE